MCGGSSEPAKPTQPYRNDPEVGKYYTSTGDDYNDWDTAYFRYQTAETQKTQKEQMDMQQRFYDQQEAAAQSQMALQADLQAQQIAAQDKMNKLQAEMQRQQTDAAKAIEEQRMAFEKDASLNREDTQRKLDMSKEAAAKQSAFDAGRANKDRKNAGGALASKGTKALQIGLNTYNPQTTAGLTIPT